MSSPSSSQLPAHRAQAVTQQISLYNSQAGQKPLQMKLKIGYGHMGNAVSDMATCSAFPPGV
jgi:hypothetical protein